MKEFKIFLMAFFAFQITLISYRLIVNYYEQKKPSEPEQVCAFWKQAYNNENSDKHHQRVLETCPEYQKSDF